jgi:hypothetical protein
MTRTPTSSSGRVAAPSDCRRLSTFLKRHRRHRRRRPRSPRRRRGTRRSRTPVTHPDRAPRRGVRMPAIESGQPPSLARRCRPWPAAVVEGRARRRGASSTPMTALSGTGCHGGGVGIHSAASPGPSHHSASERRPAFVPHSSRGGPRNDEERRVAPSRQTRRPGALLDMSGQMRG